MPRKTTRTRKRANGEEKISRPGALTLFSYIIKAPVSDGMEWIFFPVLALTAYLYNNHFQYDALLAVIFCGLTITALVHGCRNWQNDLNEYQRHVAQERQRGKIEPVRHVPGRFPSRRY
jgi:hypothetical protein